MHEQFGWVERDGVIVCGYCGSVTNQFFLDADDIIPTDKDYKVYVIKGNKQYKFYQNHYELPNE